MQTVLSFKFNIASAANIHALTGCSASQLIDFREGYVKPILPEACRGDRYFNMDQVVAQALATVRQIAELENAVQSAHIESRSHAEGLKAISGLAAAQ